MTRLAQKIIAVTGGALRQLGFEVRLFVGSRADWNTGAQASSSAGLLLNHEECGKRQRTGGRIKRFERGWEER